MQLHIQASRAALLGFLRLPRPVLARFAGAPRIAPEGAPLDLQTQALLRMMALSRRPDASQLGAAAARLEMDTWAPALQVPVDPTVRITDLRIPTRDGTLAARVYTPAEAVAPAPMLVYFHGGGFVIGSIASHDGGCRALATRSGAVVVSVEYRLAPEHRFPAGVEDAVAAFRWVVANAAMLGGAADAVAVGGDSAGGNFAAVVAQQTRGDARRPVAQLLIYPATDMLRTLPSHRHFRDGYMLTTRTIDWFLASYLEAGADKRDPRASPLYAPDVRGLPPAIVRTAGFDPLRDEGRAYADRLRDAGVPVDYRCHEGLIHGYFGMGGVIDAAAMAFDDAARALRRALAARPVEATQGPDARATA